MRWLNRFRRASGKENRSKETVSRPVVRAAPGIAAIFAGLREDRSHGVLDLSTVTEANLRLYGRFAQWIRFGDLLYDPPRGEAWTRALESLPPLPDRPYDVVMVWNLLDRLPPEDRPPLIARLAELTGPGARLYFLVDGSGGATKRTLHFSLPDINHVSQEEVGPPFPAQPPILPAGLERILSPFQVAHAFTLRGGLREYVAHWQGRDPRATTWWTR